MCGGYELGFWGWEAYGLDCVLPLEKRIGGVSTMVILFSKAFDLSMSLAVFIPGVESADFACRLRMQAQACNISNIPCWSQP